MIARFQFTQVATLTVLLSGIGVAQAKVLTFEVIDFTFQADSGEIPGIGPSGRITYSQRPGEIATAEISVEDPDADLRQGLFRINVPITVSAEGINSRIGGPFDAIYQVELPFEELIQDDGSRAISAGAHAMEIRFSDILSQGAQSDDDDDPYLCIICCPVGSMIPLDAAIGNRFGFSIQTDDGSTTETELLSLTWGAFGPEVTSRHANAVGSFQLQRTAQVIPEPTTWAGMSGAILLLILGRWSRLDYC